MAIANYTRVCAKNVPGNSRLFFTEKDNISSVTVTSGEVSAITMGTGLTFHEFKSDQKSIRRKQTESNIQGNLVVTHQVEAKFKGLSVDLNDSRDELHDALACGLVVIVVDANGVGWLIGWSDTQFGDEALDTIEAEDDSGISAADSEMGKYSLTIKGVSGYLDIPFDSTASEELLDGSATFCTFN